MTLLSLPIARSGTSHGNESSLEEVCRDGLLTDRRVARLTTTPQTGRSDSMRSRKADLFPIGNSSVEERDKSWFITRRSPVFCSIIAEMVYLLVGCKGTPVEVYRQKA
jgi:hypothetical protein